MSSDESSDKNDSPFTKDTVDTVFRAQKIAQQYGHEFVTLEHLLSALTEQQDIIDVLTEIKVDTDLLKEEVSNFLETSGAIPITHTMPHPTPLLDELLTRAVAIALMSSRGKPKPIDLIVQMVQMQPEDNFAHTILLKAGLTPLAIKKHLSHGIGTSKGARVGADGFDSQPSANINSREEAEAFIEQYAHNLNKRATESKIDPLIGRSDEVELIVQTLARRTKNNALLVGEAGVGKTAIAEGLALKIVRQEVPEAIAESTVYSLDIGLLIAGTRFRGDFEERMKQVLKALEFIPHSILFIDEIHTVMGAGSGSQGSLDVANLLKPALAKGSLRCVGSTTLEEFRKHFEKDRALLRRFKRIDVSEPSPEDTKLILRGLKTYYEDFHNVKFSDEALDAAVDLTHRYVTNAHLPDKAIDIIDQAGARQRVSLPENRKIDIGVSEIEFEVAKVSRIPAKEISEDDAEKLSRLEDNLKSKVFGQDRALVALTDAVFISRAGLKETNKPAGSYLFTGPTGVGKTETAKTIAETLGMPLLRYDMSEYMEKHSVSKLIGSPPGYVGYSEGNSGGGKLINDIDSHPYAVLLLDEVEKAHPDIFNVFLQVMDNGTLTSATGKSVPFRNVILIMTSNVGAADLAKNQIGFGQAHDPTADEPALKRTFPPEFRNRLDAIVKFDRLKPENMVMIVDKFLAQLQEMTLARGVAIDVNAEAREWLARKGYDKDFGARPLARVIQEHIKKPLSRLMLVGPLTKGGIAYIGIKDDAISIST